MSVKIKIPKYLQNKTNGEAITEVEGHTIRECIAALIRQHTALEGEILDDRGMVLLKWMVYINNGVAPSDELGHPVKDGDVIVLLPIVPGG